MRRFMCIILILAVTSFGLEIILPLLEDQRTEQLASVTDNGDEDDTDDESEDENEREELNDDLFFEFVESSANMHLSGTKKVMFGIYLLPPVTTHTEIPFSPPEMMA